MDARWGGTRKAARLEEHGSHRPHALQDPASRLRQQLQDLVGAGTLGSAAGTRSTVMSERQESGYCGELMEVPCPRGSGSSRRFSQQERTRPAWSGHA